MPRRALPPDLRAAAIAFGVQVRELRESHGWTQEQLAERADLTRTHIQNIERGSGVGRTANPTNPQLSTYMALSRALGRPIVIDVSRPSGFVVEFVPDPS